MKVKGGNSVVYFREFNFSDQEKMLDLCAKTSKKDKNFEGFDFLSHIKIKLIKIIQQKLFSLP